VETASIARAYLSLGVPSRLSTCHSVTFTTSLSLTDTLMRQSSHLNFHNSSTSCRHTNYDQIGRIVVLFLKCGNYGSELRLGGTSDRWLQYMQCTDRTYADHDASPSTTLPTSGTARTNREASARETISVRMVMELHLRSCSPPPPLLSPPILLLQETR